MPVCGYLVISRIPKANHSHVHRCHSPTDDTEGAYSCFRTQPTSMVPPPSWGLGWTLLSYPATDLTLTMSILGNHVYNSKDVEGVWTWIYTHRKLLREHLFKAGYCFVLFPGEGGGEAEFEEQGQIGKVRAGCLTSHSHETFRGETVGRYGGGYLDTSHRGKGRDQESYKIAGPASVYRTPSLGLLPSWMCAAGTFPFSVAWGLLSFLVLHNPTLCAERLLASLRELQPPVTIEPRAAHV